MGRASLALNIGVLCAFLYSILLLGVILVLDFLGLLRSGPTAVQVVAFSPAGVGALAGRLRRGPSVILPPPFSFIWIIPIDATNVSDE